MVAPRHRRGFTLVEVLIAVTLFALIMTGLVGGLRTLATGADAIDQRTRNLEDMRAIQRFMARVFERQSPATINMTGEGRWAFLGESRRMGWAGVLPARHAPYGLMWLELHMDADTSDTPGPLVLCYAPYPDERRRSLPRECERHVLLPAVQALEFGYRAPGEETWADSWTDPVRMPAAVRVRMQVEGRWWPDQILKLNSLVRT